MSNIHKLIFQKEAFDFNKGSELIFNSAMIESFNHHFNFAPLYRKICNDKDIKPWNITDYKNIPYTFVTVLKSYKFITGDEKDILIKLSSSGTGGKKTFIYLDQKSLERIEHIVHKIFKAFGMVDSKKTNYICFTYDPEIAGDVGTAFSDKMLTGLTDIGEVFYTMKYNKNIDDFELDLDSTIDKFLKFEQLKMPVRILGFPAHLYFSLIEFKKRMNRDIQLPEGSFVITGGGWKNHTGKEIKKQEFKKLLAQGLGIKVENIRDHFGMVEHGIPYVDCEYGNMHIPSYSRCFAYNPVSNKVLPHGNEGLLMLFSPYCNSYPSISLLSTDKVVIREDCPCGRGPYIDLIGRAGYKKHKGCAIVALEKLSERVRK
ncbi:MAG: hypothetical protein M0R46_00150 [Candidatus Muirbacterium halophilum]|nr:hypothetical protein [Candidatus Muirbacterium halophilum]MCK9474303.1 hypothetical protein [Candidatus Muirbacterium halophilum]